jgi:hypothetical protein
MIGAMSRTVVLAFLLASSCTKAAPNQDLASNPAGNGTSNDGAGKIAVPGGNNPETAVAVKGGPNATGGTDARNRLTAEEGKLVIEAPADAKANAEAIVKISVTPGSAFKVNTEFPTKITLENTSGITLAKAELKAGGHDQSKGDAETFSEQNLVFAVKLTPAASGSYTINGSFKFAVCDKAGSTCLAKKEPIAIQVAAK